MRFSYQREPDRMQPTEIFLSEDRAPLPPGLYLLRFEFPESSEPSRAINLGPYFIVVSNIEVTFKIGVTDTLVWAVDLRSGAPLPAAPVTISNQDGSVLATGLTDGQGVFRAAFPPRKNLYDTTYAVVGQPGQDLFGLAVSSRSAGVEPYQFGITHSPVPPGVQIYYYTDRPVYRPGQTVSFRAVVRQAQHLTTVFDYEWKGN